MSELVAGQGGGVAQPGPALAGIAAIPADGQPFGFVGCLLEKTHFVKVELRYRDTREFVRAAKCRILQAQSATNPGPLANGSLESRQLRARVYSVTFPEIDADEWDEG